MNSGRNRFRLSDTDHVADRISKLFGTARVIVSGVFSPRRKKIIMVADPEFAVVSQLERLLLRLNKHYEIINFFDGEEAFAAACGKQPDLAVVNPTLAGVGGLTLVQNLKLDPSTRRIPLILTMQLSKAALLTNLLMKKDDFQLPAIG